MTNEENPVVTTDEQGNEDQSQSSQVSVEALEILKADKERLEAELGSLKREYKKATKEKNDDGVKQTNQPDNSLLEKAFLRSAQITASDEVDLALDTARKWGVSVDQLVDDEDFQVKLDKLRTKKANTLATSDIRGSGSGSQAKNTPEYWIAKGTPPSTQDVPDRKTRAKIARAMLANAKSSKTFYND